MKILIVEDESVVARRLRRLLSELLGERISRLDHEKSLDEAMNRLKGEPVDVLFLDLNLAGRDGFELLAKAVAGPQQTIVVSANTDRAMEAFEYGVVDFVGKPFDSARLQTAIDRLDAIRHPKAEKLKYLSVRGGRGIELVPLENLQAVHGAGDYAELELVDGRRLLHDKTMDQFESLLPEAFLRIHRSHIVRWSNITHLRSLPGSRYQVELNSGTTLPVGRQRVAKLRRNMD